MFRLITCSVVAIALVFLLISPADGGMIYPSQSPSALAGEWTSAWPSLGAIEAHRRGPRPLGNDLTHLEPSEPNALDVSFRASDENWLEAPMSVNEGKAIIGTFIGGPAPRIDSGFTTQSLMPTYNPAFIAPTTKGVDVWTTWVLPSGLGRTSWSSTLPALSTVTAPNLRVTSLLPGNTWSAQIENGQMRMENSWLNLPVAIKPVAQLPGELYVSALPSLPLPMREVPDPLRSDPLPDDAMPVSSGTEVLERALKRAGRELMSDTGDVKSRRTPSKQSI